MPVRRKGFSDPEKMWTAAADNVAFFFPVVSTKETADLAGVRPAFELTHMTGAANAILITPAYQLSNDGEVWDDSHTCTVIPNVTTRSADPDPVALSVAWFVFARHQFGSVEVHSEQLMFITGDSVFANPVLS